MYTAHFGLKAQPFVERLSPERIIRDKRMQEGLARLTYTVEAANAGVLIGQTGVGKSCLLKLFLHTLSRNRYKPIYLNLTHVNGVGLLRLIVRSLGELPKRGKEALFLQILQLTKKAEATTVLLIDEAHLADPEGLVDLRLLLSSDLAEEPPLKLILSGQEGLGAILRRSRHSDLLNRISVRYHLRPFTPKETVSYIDAQLSQAGGSGKLFDLDAKKLIHEYTAGVPRQINNLATACMLNAASQDLKKVTPELVDQTMAEFELP